MTCWIKCSEKKPPKDRPFLGFGLDALYEDEEIITMIYHKGGVDSDGYDCIEGYYALGQWGNYNREHFCSPTHWMELPETPND